jgi:hypothetical protein
MTLLRGAVAAGQTPDNGKDWMHPSDYLLPVSVHSIPVADCQPMIRDLRALGQVLTGKGHVKASLGQVLTIMSH